MRVPKKISLPILLFFWAYTWHAYAVGSLESFVLSDSSQTAYGRASDDLAPEKIHNKIQFKRRPFLDKGEALVLEPLQLSWMASFTRRSILAECFLFHPSPERAPHLRSPPVFIR